MKILDIVLVLLFFTEFAPDTQVFLEANPDLILYKEEPPTDTVSDASQISTSVIIYLIATILILVL